MIRKKNPTILLNEAFPDWMTTGGFFSLLTNPPWQMQSIDPLLLDLEYFGNHSGEKPIAPLLHKLLDANKILDLTARTTLARLVMAKFYQPWRKLYDTYYINYDPLDNYRMNETGSEVTDADNSHSDTITYGGTTTGTTMGSDSRSRSRYGFNSATAVPTDEESGQSQGTTTTATGGSDTTSGTRSDDKTVEYERNRTGNNGNISFQQLIKEDRDLWLEDYFARIYRDIDSVLTEPIYPSKRRLSSVFWIPSYQNI